MKKSRKIAKSILSLTLALIMVLGVAPLSQLAGVDWAGLFAPKAEALQITSYKTGDIIEFGWYPQSKVTDSSLISALTAAAGDNKSWTSYGYYSGTGSWSDSQMTASDYMRYKDVVYGLNKYRGVVFDSYRPYGTGYTSSPSYTYQDDNGYSTGTVYWFKYEPIEWRVLDPNTGMVMSETILDSQAYNNYILSSGTDEYGYTAYWGDASKTYYANNYAESSIRKWLNNDFYNTAFSAEQKNSISTTHLDNSAYSSSYSAYDSEDTYDKIYLLSYNDAKNSSYGFSSNAGDYDTARRAQGSDYAKCQGLRVSTSSSYSGNSYWRLRSAGSKCSHTCIVSYDGNAYNYDFDNASGSDLGVRPAFNFNLKSGIFQSDVTDTGNSSSSGSGTEEDYSREQYVTEHINFANQKYDSFERDNGFYNVVWSEENSKRLFWFKLWDVVGDVGEIATFKFDDLTISADYYQLFLADLIVKINSSSDTMQKELNKKAFSTYNSTYGKLKKCLKSTSEWEKSVSGDTELEIEGFFTDPDYKLSEKTEGILRKILKESYETDKETMKSVFNGLSVANDLCDYISTSADIVNAFREANNAYTVALSFKSVNSEIFNILYAAIDEMETTNPKYAKWFRESLDLYYAMNVTDKEIVSWALSVAKDTATLTYDLAVKKQIQNWSYKMVSKVLGCDAGKLGMSAFWITFSYNTTYGVLNALLPMGKASTPYYIMNYVSPFEDALSRTVKSYANKLKNNQTYENAVNYDFAYNVLKATNTYLYECSYNFCAAQNESEDMKYSTYYKNMWVNQKCHDGTLNSSKTKYVSAQCPVDVYVYNSSDKLMLSIVDENITECDSSVTVMNYDGKKAFCYSADDEYRVEITARTDGTMDYYVSDMSDGKSEADFEFYDIPLSKGEKFTGSLSISTNPNEIDDRIKSDKCGDIECNYNSSKATSCAENGHQFGDWTVRRESSCYKAGCQKRVCTACGKNEFKGIDIKHGEAELKNYKEVGCETDGYTGDKCCKICGELLEMGETVKSSGHSWGEWKTKLEPTVTSEGCKERECDKCHGIESEKIPMLEPISVSEISLNLNELSLKVGENNSLVATLAPDNATDKTVTWTSSDSTVATVDENGVVTAVSVGTATITATASNGLTAECAITVEEESKSILDIILGILLKPIYKN